MSSISVVIPTYNRARWLSETVGSVLNQTRTPDEILIIDDGSTDETAEVCRAFAPPVRYIRQENAGVSAARNHGVKEAKGEWVAFLDSDDLWHPAKLAVQLAAIQQVPGARWSTTACALVDVASREIPSLGFEHAVPVFHEFGLSPDEFFGQALTRSEVEHKGSGHIVYSGDVFGLLFFGNFVIPSAALVRRDMFLGLSGFDEQFRLAEETEFFHRLAAESPAAIIMSPLLLWRVGHEVRLTGNANVKKLIQNALLSAERARALRSNLSQAEQRAMRLGRERLQLRLAYTYLSLFERDAARDTVFQAWRAGATYSTRSLAIAAGSYLPAAILKGIHRMKRYLAR